jgi:hypothetical protein
MRPPAYLRRLGATTPVKPANAPHGVGHLAPALVLPQPPAPKAGALSDHQQHRDTVRLRELV